VVRRLAADIPAFTLDAWVRPLIVKKDGTSLRLLCPTQFHRDRVRERFQRRIEECAAAEAGLPIEIEFAVGGTNASNAPAGEAGAAKSLRTDAPAGEKPRSVKPAPRNAATPGPAAPRRRATQTAFSHTFDSFVVGPCNALAREASVAVAHSAQESLRLFYMKSDTGLGKTHLARAIVAEARSGSRRNALYTSAEAFTNDFMQSIRSKQMDRFKQRYRDSCDLLVLEDVPFLGSKKATQLELFHTLTHLIDSGASVVLTGNCLPREIPGVDPRLASQMTAGLVAELEPPSAQVRRKILRSKAARGGVALPDECLDLLVERVRGNVRDLEGVLIQLVSTASLLKRRIDLDLTEAALRKVSDPADVVRPLEPRQVIEVVAAFFRSDPATLASRSRRRDVLVPRQLAMYLCRRHTDASVADIAHCFGRRHTSVANAEKVIARDMLERAPLRYQVEALSERVDALEREVRRGSIGSGI
jgi:chromosomal replication initiator protein